MKELKEHGKNRVIRISEANKGGAIVVQNADTYLDDAKRQLDNKTHYKKIEGQDKNYCETVQ